MNDLEFLLLRNKNKKLLPTMEFPVYTDSPYVYKQAGHSIDEQSKSLTGLSIGKTVIEYEEIPSKINASILCILDENSIVPSDYINRILAMNNLHTRASFFCGPVFNTSPVIPTDLLNSKISNSYKTYGLNEFGSFISCYLNDDFRNYPPIHGNIFIGSYYNSVGGYNPVISPRGRVYRNPKFFDRLEKTSTDIIYSSRLSTGYFITAEELSIENFSSYYYALGYSDGLNASTKDMEDQYIKCHNMLDIEDPSWITQGPEAQNEIYKKYLYVLKCNYDVGYFEAISKTKII